LQRYAYYSNLPFGDYVFKAKAISSDNIESENIKSFSLEILPPWYRTWYMSIVFFVVVIFIIGGFIFIIINRQRLIFEKRIDKLTIENNESKMVFLTNIAHELKTPLSLVIAPIDDVMQNYKNIDPFWKNHLQLVFRNSKYLLKLINQFIDFRKLNAGKLKLYPQNTDIVRLIKDVVMNFKYMESRRKVNLNINVPANKVIISIDSQKIEEVLYNLLSNAFKHTEDNKSITVSLEIFDGKITGKKSLDSKQLRISVFNEGREINDEDKIKIFERFYKTDESIEGAGIGLSFSKSLIEMHSGFIEVESIKDEGVVFHAYLPFNETISNELPESKADLDVEMFQLNQPELINQLVSENGKEKDLKIVIVEDNIELRTFLKNILSRIYTCFEASDGNEGWKIIKEIIPDVVISDIIMPNKDGYQMCKQLKENLKTCHIPVILLTAKNAESQIISGYNVGADAYVTKPFDMNLILSQISRLIKNRELIREKYITQNFMVEVTKTNISKDDEFIMSVRAILEENITDSDFNVKKLSAQLNISTTQLYRKLKALTGYSPVEFIRVIKLQKAYNLLNTRNNTVKEVCYLSGFNNLSYFIKCFREHFGITPANYRDKGFADQFQVDNTNITNMS
ncbi:MAG: response regulator, partial [Mariniphaga sp.]|nr:response regulator [Mariniphaga sp.]